MDISSIAPQSFDLEIKHPVSGSKVGLTITLISPSDPKMKAAQRVVTDKALKKRARSKQFTAEEIETNGVDLLAATITGWTWGKDDDGKEGSFGGTQMKFSDANARKLIGVDWIKDQIEEALAEPANFFRG